MTSTDYVKDFTMFGYVGQYIEFIKENPKKVGQEIKQQYRIIEDILENIESEDSKYYYNTSKSDRLIHFMENVVPITSSEGFGKTIKLMLWQKAAIELTYSLKFKENDMEVYNRVVLLISKKCGKSGLAASWITSELVLGNGGMNMIVGSNTKAQAGMIYDVVDNIRESIDPKQSDLKRNQSALSNRHNRSKVKRMSAEAGGSNDGEIIDLAFIDEYHEVDDNEFYNMINQGRSASPKSKLIIVTTEGFKRNGGLSDLLKECRAILAGENTTRVAERTLSLLYTQDSESEIFGDNEEVWLKSNPSLYVTKDIDYLRSQVEDARTNASNRAAILTKDFNWPVVGESHWLNEEDYTYPQDTVDFEEFRGGYMMVGADLAMLHDLSALSFMFVKDGKIKFINKAFIPAIKLTGGLDKRSGAKYEDWIKSGDVIVSGESEVNLYELADYITNISSEFGINIHSIGYDQRFANLFINRLEEQFGTGRINIEVLNPVGKTLNSPIRYLENEIKRKNIHFGNNELTEWTLGNCGVTAGADGLLILSKKGGDSAFKIDVADAMVNAIEMYRRNKTEFDSLSGGN